MCMLKVMVTQLCTGKTEKSCNTTKLAQLNGNKPQHNGKQATTQRKLAQLNGTNRNTMETSNNTAKLAQLNGNKPQHNGNKQQHSEISTTHEISPICCVVHYMKVHNFFSTLIQSS